jgi:hypothetical protein
MSKLTRAGVTADSRRRWDTDDRFVGVSDASGFAESIEDLAELARRLGRVAVVPDTIRLRWPGAEGDQG